MKISHISSHQVQPTKKYIFDTNIWLYLLPLQRNQSGYHQNNAALYSSLLSNILSNGCKIAILSIEVSEIFNVYLRERGKFFLNSQNKQYSSRNYKRIYRKSQSFINDKNYIASEISQNILTFCSKVDDNFSVLSNNCMLGNGIMAFDFNDNYLLNFCELENYVFVSHDKDCQNISYQNLNLEVVTANI